MDQGFPGVLSSRYHWVKAETLKTGQKNTSFVDKGVFGSILIGHECDKDAQGTLVQEKGFGRVSGTFRPGTCGISAGFGVV